MERVANKAYDLVNVVMSVFFLVIYINDNKFDLRDRS